MTAPEPQFVDDRLAHWASVNPGGECLTYGQRTWTWAQFYDRVRRVAGGLRELGVGRGDVVAVVNWRLAGDEVGFTLNDSRAKVIVVGSELRGSLDAIRDQLPHVERILEVTTDGEGDAYEEWLAASTPVDRDPETSPDDTCLVLYSSGTTGRPK